MYFFKENDLHEDGKAYKGLFYSLDEICVVVSPPLITDHSNIVAVFLNTCKIQVFKPDLILGTLFKQAMYLKSQTE